MKQYNIEEIERILFADDNGDHHWEMKLTIKKWGFFEKIEMRLRTAMYRIKTAYRAYKNPLAFNDKSPMWFMGNKQPHKPKEK